jgi:hypothetical protein
MAFIAVSAYVGLDRETKEKKGYPGSFRNVLAAGFEMMSIS